jgi:hypothetical protein
MKRRQDGFDGQLDLDPERLVFIDETWASTTMARSSGRAPEGERLRAIPPPPLEDDDVRRRAAPDRNGRADGARRADQRRRLPSLCRPGPCPGTQGGRHRRDRQPRQPQGRASVRAAIEAAGAKLLYLPPYSPDFNPIETAFASSRPSCAKAAEPPSKSSGTRSGRSWPSSAQPSAQITSPPPVMTQNKPNPV